MGPETDDSAVRPTNIARMGPDFNDSFRAGRMARLPFAQGRRPPARPRSPLA
jgi:hypothetical protein